MAPSHAKELVYRGGHALRVAVISAFLLAPCFWHRHLEAGDLGSHVYNAWLAELVRSGRAPGLWIATQWNNVLFDWMLDGLGSCLGLMAAEKIAVAASVLVFFWGAFALVSALTGRRPWFLVPVLAMVTYGWTFYMGFFNYHLSIGLSLWALVCLLRSGGMWKLLAAALGAMTWFAHPMGTLWLVCAAAYFALASVAGRRVQVALAAAAAAVLFLAGHILRAHFETSFLTFATACGVNGSDQIVLREPYRLLAIALTLSGFLVVFGEYVKCRFEPGRFWPRFGMPIQLFLILWVGAWALPDFIAIPGMGRFGFIAERSSLISAVLACAVIGAAGYRRSLAIYCWAIAACYFALSYQDTGVLSRMETKVDSLLSAVGSGQRVFSTIDFGQRGSRLLFNHMVDRECVGRCFSFGNYEPATGHFRIRAKPDNGIVAATKFDVDAIWGGAYVVNATDLPAYGVYQPGGDWTVLAIRPLHAGEENGRRVVSQAAGPIP